MGMGVLLVIARDPPPSRSGATCRCKSDEGRGDGPAVTALPVKPPDLRDPGMVGEMAGSDWFWRISEGGLVEPFRSKGSIMPAWKDESCRSRTAGR